jgi:heme-degrading monooxygenase HmoA
MIARMWHGKVPAQKASDYHQFLLQSGLKDYEETKGNKGIFLLKREEGDVTHFYTLTFWEDTEAIIRFAGHDHEKARYYPEDKDFLLEFEPFVTHYQVIEKPKEF